MATFVGDVGVRWRLEFRINSEYVHDLHSVPNFLIEILFMCLIYEIRQWGWA